MKCQRQVIFNCENDRNFKKKKIQKNRIFDDPGARTI